MPIWVPVIFVVPAVVLVTGAVAFMIDRLNRNDN